MVRGYIYATGVLIKKYRTLVKIKHISREGNDCQQYSLRSNLFQSSYWAKNVRAGAKKRWKEKGKGRRGNACPQTPRFWKMPLDIV